MSVTPIPPKTSTLVCRYALENRDLRERAEKMSGMVADLLRIAAEQKSQLELLMAENAKLAVMVAARDRAIACIRRENN